MTQDSYLNYSPREEEKPKETLENYSKPTASPIILSSESIVNDFFPTDSSGITISDVETHYYKYYVSYSDIRLYEEDQHCYFDAICVNGFDKTLSGRCNISFFDDAGRICGTGVIHTADDLSAMLLQPGNNRIFSEIQSEIDISSCYFEIINDGPFLPVQND